MWVAAILVVSIVKEKEFAVFLATTSLIDLGKEIMKKLLLTFLLLLSPIASADMDNLCFIYIKEFGTNDILNGIKEQGCVRNNVLQVVYGMDATPETIMKFHSGRWCRFDRNMNIMVTCS